MSTKGKRITISRAETVYRERSFTRAQIIGILTDELSEPVADRRTLANMTDVELAETLTAELAEYGELSDLFTDGYYELYEDDSSYGDFTVEVQK